MKLGRKTGAPVLEGDMGMGDSVTNGSGSKELSNDEHATLEDGNGRIPLTIDLRDMVDAVPVVLTFFDADLICRFANEYLHSWYRSSPHEMVGRHLRDIIGEKDFAARAPHLARAYRGEKSVFEIAVPIRDGTYRDAAVTYTPKMGPSGFEGVYILAFDVAMLRQRFHSVFDGTAVGFWMIDIAGLKQVLLNLAADDRDQLSAAIAAAPRLVRHALSVMLVTDLNEKACHLVGVSADEARGQPIGRWCPDESLPAFGEMFSSFLAGEKFFEAETTMLTQAGQRLDVLLTCAFAKKDLNDTKLIIGTTDISARVRKEHELARAQSELVHAARGALLGELMASIAHEVNQPLTSITTDGVAALRWLERSEPDFNEIRSAIGRMIAESKRASDVIARTKNLAMRKPGARIKFTINKMIEDTVAIVRRQMVNLGAELTLELERNIPDVVADRIQIQQVLINLVINAAQAMTARPPPRRVVIRTFHDAGSVGVAVADNGPGIPENENRLFDSFFTTKETGMGMGLAVSKTILDAHGGLIRIEPTPGGGATFVFTLPADPAG
jgi:PAS domain S-box-containing protein